jgi:anti-sigma factor ChrR (cupin superfamily)
MQLRHDLSQRVVVRPGDDAFVPSPQVGVERLMLDRDGDEVGRATSLVRYAPHSSFPEHVHGGGEEIFVIEGTFEDEHGVYPAGTYLRNARGSRHAPRSVSGCVLFVKLHQFQVGDDAQVHIATTETPWRQGLVPGLRVMPLHEHGGEHVALVRWAPGTVFQRHSHMGGEEILVLEGMFQDEHGDYPQGTWLRSPHWSTHAPFSKSGCTILVKVGHL